MQFSKRMKVSAQDTTTITLVPEVGDDVAGDFARSLTNIVLTWPTARDENLFSTGAAAINFRYQITIQKL